MIYVQKHKGFVNTIKNGVPLVKKWYPLLRNNAGVLEIA